MEQVILKALGITPTHEQHAILDLFASGNNLRLIAHPGAGKTTMSLMLVIEANERGKNKSIIITYSSALKTELRERLKHINVDCTSESIHSSGHHYVAMGKSFEDIDLQFILEENLPSSFEKYNVIVIDEMQDLTPVYATYLRKFITDHSTPETQFVFLGDPKQSIYQFRSASAYYLENAEEFFGPSCITMPLQTTYRLPQKHCDLLNDLSVCEPPLIAFQDKKGTLDYLYLDLSKNIDEFFEHLFQVMKDHEVTSFEDVMILAPSTQTSKYERIFSHIVRTLKIPIHIIQSKKPSEIERSKLCLNKAVASTIHASKGKEAKIVLLLSFDDAYRRTFYRDDERSLTDIFDELLFVAVSRAKNALIVMHLAGEPYLPMIDREIIDKHFRYIALSTRPIPIPVDKSQWSKDFYTVTEVCSFLPFTLDARSHFLKTHTIEEEISMNRMQTTTYHGFQINEDFSTYVGELVTEYLLYCLNPYKCINGFRCIRNSLETTFASYPLFIEAYDKSMKQLEMEEDSRQPPDLCNLLFLCYMKTHKTDMSHIWRQKATFLLGDRHPNSLLAIMNVSAQMLFRTRIDAIARTYPDGDAEVNVRHVPIRLMGRMDFIDYTESSKLVTIYELKCKHRLTNDDFIQTMLYGALVRWESPDIKTFHLKLYNVMTNEEYTITLDKDSDWDFIEPLVEHVQTVTGVDI